MNLRKFLPTYGVLVAFVLILLFALIKYPAFSSPENLRNLFNQNAAVGMMAVGMTFVILTGGIDLSVGSLAALCGTLALLAMKNASEHGQSEAMAVLIASLASLAVGVGFGALQGVSITYGRVAPFVTTLIGLLACRSMAQAFADGGEVRSVSTTIYPGIGSGGVPIPFLHTASGPLIVNWAIIVWLILSLLGSLLLNKTAFGRYVIAIGANVRAARYSGIPITRIKILVYALSGLCVAFAAIGQTSRLNSLSTGSQFLYFELDAIAAVVIGGTSLRGGYGRLWGTLVGVLLLGAINQVLVFENVSIYWQQAVKGLIILCAVLLQRQASEE